MESSAKKNFIYNVIYQILAMIIPILTAPYLARTIGADGIGVYSYTYSVIYYFMLLTMLGINNYGNRTVAKAREDKNKLSKTFISIYTIQLASGLLMLVLYLAFVLAFDNQNRIIALLQTPFMISAILDINWLFFGLEDFKKTVTRNSIVKIANVILIFLLVKNTNDVWKYTIIMSGMTCISQLILWGFARKKIKFEKVKICEIKKHLKPVFILFIPVIAVSLYKMMDKIMLGSISGMTEVGLYENAEKITNIPLAIITALGTVMLPRISNIIAKGENEKVKKYISKSMKFIAFSSLVTSAGLIAIGQKFSLLFLGDEFEKAGTLILLLSCTLPIISFANVIRTQYLIPKEKDNIYITSVFLGAIVNLAMNAILIPGFKSNGACIGTIAAELIVMAYQAYRVRKELPIRKYIIDFIPFLAKAIIVLTITYPLNFIEMNDWIRLCIQTLLGGSIYFILNSKYIKTNINLKKLLKRKRLTNNYGKSSIELTGSQ